MADNKEDRAEEKVILQALHTRIFYSETVTIFIVDVFAKEIKNSESREMIDKFDEEFRNIDDNAFNSVELQWSVFRQGTIIRKGAITFK